MLQFVSWFHIMGIWKFKCNFIKTVNHSVRSILWSVTRWATSGPRVVATVYLSSQLVAFLGQISVLLKKLNPESLKRILGYRVKKYELHHLEICGPNYAQYPKIRMNGKKLSQFQFHFPGLLKACLMQKKNSKRIYFLTFLACF